MSLERMINTAPKGAGFVEHVIRRAEFRNGHSRMNAFAETIYNEGRAGLAESYEALGRQRKPVPRSPISPEIPPEFTGRIRLNGASVLWGALFPVVEAVIIDRVYDPAKFFTRFKMGFAGSAWHSAITTPERRAEFYNHDSVRDLTRAATADKTFSFLFTDEGYNLLPITLQASLHSTGFHLDLRDKFAPIYIPLAKSLLNSPLTPDEISRRETARPQPPRFVHKPLGFGPSQA